MTTLFQAAMTLEGLCSGDNINTAGREALDVLMSEIQRLQQSEREGWRWADECDQERSRQQQMNADLRDALIQMIACHDEPTCPAIAVARAALEQKA